MIVFNETSNTSNAETKSRTIFLKDDLTSETMSDIVEKIYNFNQEDADAEVWVKDYYREPIRLVINTHGGDAYCCLSLIDVIESSITPIYTIALNAFSAGLFILIAGHKRFAYKRSTMMYHQVQVDPGYGDLKSIKHEIEESKRIEGIIKEFLFEKTKLTPELLELVDTTDKEWYIDANEALSYGIIDQILVKEDRASI
jgi:ATP-dependent Clp protease protease subunit